MVTVTHNILRIAHFKSLFNSIYLLNPSFWYSHTSAIGNCLPNPLDNFNLSYNQALVEQGINESSGTRLTKVNLQTNLSILKY